MLPSAARTDPRPANNILLFLPCSKLVLQIITNGFFLRNFVIESACAPSTNEF